MNNVVVIVGGSGAIGSATCRALVADGTHVVVVDARADLTLVAESAGMVEMVVGDGTDAASIERITADIGARHRVTGFAYMLGWVRVAPSAEVSVAEFEHTLQVNLTAQFAWAKEMYALMRPHGAGSIVLMSSVLSFGGTPGRAAYNASRGAVNQLVKSLAVEWATSGVRVNSIAPGWTLTPLLESQGLGLDALRRRVPMKRLATPQDIAEPVRFLLGEGGAYITGVTLPVDGGTSAFLGPGDPPD